LCIVAQKFQLSLFFFFLVDSFLFIQTYLWVPAPFFSPKSPPVILRRLALTRFLPGPNGCLTTLTSSDLKRCHALIFVKAVPFSILHLLFFSSNHMWRRLQGRPSPQVSGSLSARQLYRHRAVGVGCCGCCGGGGCPVVGLGVLPVFVGGGVGGWGWG